MKSIFRREKIDKMRWNLPFPVRCTILSSARFAQFDKRRSVGIAGVQATGGPTLRVLK